MKPSNGDVTREFAGLQLNDKRLESRAVSIAARLSTSPSDSFPDAMETDAELEALYRFLSNPKVTTDGLLAGHVRASQERIRGRAVVRVLHDTSAFRFEGDRDGLGLIFGDVRGFLGHFSLAVSADEDREPLGVLGLHPFVHADAVAHRGMTKSERTLLTLSKDRSERESSRWEKQALAVEALLPDGTRGIHVMDRECDDLYLFAALIEARISFVVRASPKRKTLDDIHARDRLAAGTTELLRTVYVNPRKPMRGKKTRHPMRDERFATLKVRWGAVTIPRSRATRIEAEELTMNAVHVFEPAPPEGDEPIEWMLFTSERVDSLEDATAIVDHYRARWVIEEYFKALKTGCAVEKRQLTTYDGLTNALALYVPIAWHMLQLRHLSREEKQRPASHVFDAEQLLLLAALMKERRLALNADATVRDAMLAIARLGGHIKNNGDPGWQVLGRGFVKFIEAEAGWRLARRSDQS